MRKSSRNIDSFVWRSATESRVRDAAMSQGPERNAGWKEIVRRHGPALTRAIEGVLRWKGYSNDSATIEDIVESTWLRVTKGDCKKLRTWDPLVGASLGTHLVRIGMGEALSWCRFSATRREALMSSHGLYGLADKPDRNLSPEQAFWLDEAEKAVKNWEAGLGQNEQRILSLWREGYDQAKIAQDLNRSQQFVSRTSIGLKAAAHRLIEDLVS